eukprot:COSAG02_NODE_572_length_20163_cov_9.875461_16_plen_115_part_00
MIPSGAFLTSFVQVAPSVCDTLQGAYCQQPRTHRYGLRPHGIAVRGQRKQTDLLELPVGKQAMVLVPEYTAVGTLDLLSGTCHVPETGVVLYVYTRHRSQSDRGVEPTGDRAGV